MKYFCLIPIWSVLVGVGFFTASANLTQADPADDLSFTLSFSPELDIYSLISERRVADILADRLDLFPVSLTPRLAHHLVALCKQYRFDPAFVLSLIQVESAFHVKAVSPVGAIGLMQVMPATANHVVHGLGIRFANTAEVQHFRATHKIVSERALSDPFVNIAIGIAYLAWLRDHYQGVSPYYLVAAYNIGPAKLDELRVRKDFRPSGTKKYYEAIRRGVPKFRFYHRIHPGVIPGQDEGVALTRNKLGV